MTNDVTKTNPILIDIPMPIVTARLTIRPPCAGDGAAMFAAKKKSFEDLNQWMPWAKELGTIEQSEIAAREAQANFQNRTDMMLLGFLNDGGDLAVSTGLHRMDWDLRIFEIGYWVPTPFAGRGIATETTNALIRYAFGALNATKVRICHATGNDASRCVIEKLGFEREGVFKRDARKNDGSLTDHYWYARFDDKNLPDLKVTW
jgi:RimJ/RimL family protein N-acetyltransferase